MLVQGVDACHVAAAHAEVNSQALACSRVVMVLGLWASDGTSLSLEGVVAGVGRPPGLSGAGPCWFDTLGGSTSHRGWLPCVYLAVVSGREGPHAPMLEPSLCLCF